MHRNTSRIKFYTRQLEYCLNLLRCCHTHTHLTQPLSLCHTHTHTYSIYTGEWGYWGCGGRQPEVCREVRFQRLDQRRTSGFARSGRKREFHVTTNRKARRDVSGSPILAAVNNVSLWSLQSTAPGHTLMPFCVWRCRNMILLTFALPCFLYKPRQLPFILWFHIKQLQKQVTQCINCNLVCFIVVPNVPFYCFLSQTQYTTCLGQKRTVSCSMHIFGSLRMVKYLELGVSVNQRDVGTSEGSIPEEHAGLLLW